MTPEELKEIEERAKKENRTRSNLILTAILAYLSPSE